LFARCLEFIGKGAQLCLRGDDAGFLDGRCIERQRMVRLLRIDKGDRACRKKQA
jgi:hypothetical protein